VALDSEYNTIRDEISRSPKGIKPTHQRLEFLVKAKKLRNVKQMHVTQKLTAIGDKTRTEGYSKAQVWAA